MEKDPLSIEDHETESSIAKHYSLLDEVKESYMINAEGGDISNAKNLVVDLLDEIISSTINAIETQFFCIFCQCLVIDFNQRETKYQLHLAHHHFAKMIFECKIKLFWLAAWACYNNDNQPCVLGGFGVEDYIDHLITKHGLMEKWGLMRIQRLEKKRLEIEPLTQSEEQELDKLICLMKDPLFSNNPCQKKPFLYQIFIHKNNWTTI